MIDRLMLLQFFETTEHLSFHGKDPSALPYNNFYISYGDSGETLTSAVLGGYIISGMPMH